MLENGEVMFHGPVRQVLENSRQMEEAGIHVPRIVSLHEELSRLGLISRPAPINMDEAETMAREALK